MKDVLMRSKLGFAVVFLLTAISPFLTFQKTKRGWLANRNSSLAHGKHHSLDDSTQEHKIHNGTTENDGGGSLGGQQLQITRRRATTTTATTATTNTKTATTNTNTATTNTKTAPPAITTKAPLTAPPATATATEPTTITVKTQPLRSVFPPVDPINYYTDGRSWTFGECGPGESYTSSRKTAAHFTTTAQLTVLSRRTILQPQQRPTIVMFEEIALTFQAIDIKGQPRKTGGDYFVVELTYWMRSPYATHGASVYKTASPAYDLGGGQYTVHLTLPTLPLKHLKLNLLHHSTCYQGLGVLKRRHTDSFYKIQYGPQKVPSTNVVLNYVQEQRQDQLAQDNYTIATHYGAFGEFTNALPVCETSQKGMDDLTVGAWVQPNTPVGEPPLYGASWIPFSCRPKKRKLKAKVTRIGDSTMPSKTLEIGDPYHHYLEFGTGFVHHKRWTKYLWTQTYNKTTTTNDNGNNSKDDSNHVLLFSGGLHPLIPKTYKREVYRNGTAFYKGYSIPAAVTILTRMICQLALVHPQSKLIVVGVTPIQQQYFDQVDLTDQNVIWLNTYLRHRLITTSQGGRLSHICDPKGLGTTDGDDGGDNAGTDVTKLWSLADEQGNIMSEKATTARRRFQSLGLVEQPEEQEIAAYMESLTKEHLQQQYGERVVAFADIHDFMLPRSECYNDKIHSFKLLNRTDTGRRGSLMTGRYKEFLDTLAWIRGDMAYP